MHCQWGWRSSFPGFVPGPGNLDFWPLTLTSKLVRVRDKHVFHVNLAQIRWAVHEILRHNQTKKSRTAALKTEPYFRAVKTNKWPSLNACHTHFRNYPWDWATKYRLFSTNQRKQHTDNFWWTLLVQETEFLQMRDIGLINSRIPCNI